MADREEEFKCTLRQMSEWNIVTKPDPRDTTRLGRYHNSFFSDIHDYGKSKWIVMVEILVDKNIKKLLKSGITEEEIVERCTEYLNTPPPRKKYSRRQPKPLYGILKLYRYFKTIKRQDNKKYFQVQYITDKKKSKYFWGQGFTNNVTRARRRKRVQAV